MQKLFIVFSVILLLGTSAYGWNDKTHLAIAKAAGYESWYNAAGADITKLKAGDVEQCNHRCFKSGSEPVTPDFVLAQIKQYNSPDDQDGHLYGAIIASLRGYRSSKDSPKYAEYHLAFCCHYAGDLSQPFHSMKDASGGAPSHNANDGIVEDGALENIAAIKSNMRPVEVRPDFFETDIAAEIARIANRSRELGMKLKQEKRDLTKDEAYMQLGQSASLLQAILKYMGKLK